MTKVNFIYRNCIQLRWIPAILLGHPQSSRRYPGSDTVSNRSYIATHHKFRIVTEQRKKFIAQVQHFIVSWLQRRQAPVELNRLRPSLTSSLIE